MDNSSGFGVIGSSKTVKKKRSIPFRRPRDESESLPDNRDSPSLSSTPPSVSVSKASSDDNNGDAGLEFKRSNDESIQGNLKSISGQPRIGSDIAANENKLKKVKLKVGGITHTIHTKATSDGSSLAASSSTKSSHSSYTSQKGHKLIVQGRPDDDFTCYMENQSGLRGVPWKDFSKTGFGVGKSDPSGRRMPEETTSVKHSDNYELTKKSKRVQKKRSLSGVIDDDDIDDEIRYLEKLKSSKSVAKYSADYDDEDEEGSRKQRPISRVLNRKVDGYDVNSRDFNPSRSGKESKKLRPERGSEDTDYEEEDESVSDTDPEPKKKKQRKELTNVMGDSGQELAITTRRRALLVGKGISSGSVSSLIEFPNGLPPAPPKKQKEQLSEVEQQLKRAEALQRRRMQVEKANRESEAEAIRKILGQDSSRKKREDKIKKRQEERTASSSTLPSDAVRWVIGPSGTVVTFPDEIGLPSIFEQKPCSYPPPREKCAAPACSNDYKYRDSKSKLPLCSLQCYKAIHEKMASLTAC